MHFPVFNLNSNNIKVKEDLSKQGRLKNAFEISRYIYAGSKRKMQKKNDDKKSVKQTE